MFPIIVIYQFSPQGGAQMNEKRSRFLIFSVLYCTKDIKFKAIVRRVTPREADLICQKIFNNGGGIVKADEYQDTPASPGFGIERKRQTMQIEAALMNEAIPNARLQVSTNQEGFAEQCLSLRKTSYEIIMQAKGGCHGITLKEKLSRERFKIRLFKAMLNVLGRTKFPRIVASGVRQCETLQISKVRKPANFIRSQFATG